MWLEIFFRIPVKMLSQIDEKSIKVKKSKRYVKNHIVSL